MNTVLGRRSRILAATTATAGLLLVAGCSSDDSGGASKTAAGGVNCQGRAAHGLHPPARTRPSSRRSTARCRASTSRSIDLAAKNLGVKQEILDTPFENFKTGAFLNSGQCDLGRGRHDHHRRSARRTSTSPTPTSTPPRPSWSTRRAASPRSPTSRARRSAPRRRRPARTTPRSKGLDPVSFESSDAVLNGLRTGQVEAVIIDYPVVQGWLKDPGQRRRLRGGRQPRHR